MSAVRRWPAEKLTQLNNVLQRSIMYGQVTAWGDDNREKRKEERGVCFSYPSLRLLAAPATRSLTLELIEPSL